MGFRKTRTIEINPPLPPNAALRWDVVARLLPLGAEDVLEVGCGQGAVAVRLARRLRYVGIDLDADSVEATGKRLADAGVEGDVLLGDTDVLADGAVFDLVCAFEVLEHIEDDHAALAEWARRLRPGGTLIVSVPAWQRRYSQWDELAGHFRRYDPGLMRAALDRAGLLDTRAIAYGWPLSYLLEGVRNVIARRRGVASAGDTFQARTEASGRLFRQLPQGPAAVALAAGLRPFALIQRTTTTRGPNLLGVGRAPSAA